MSTQITDLNITTSAATYLANQFTGAGWLVHWQATGVDSGTATVGEVTLVPEFPKEPNLMVLPTSPIQARTTNEVILPAFAIRMSVEPNEEVRAGLGEDLFFQRGTLMVDGFVTDQAEHLAFSTMFRDWFREGYALPIFDFENTPSNPPLLTDSNVSFENRSLDRVELVDDPGVPPYIRYYLNLEVDFVFFD
jgi:hypothetical protein